MAYTRDARNARGRVAQGAAQFVFRLFRAFAEPLAVHGGRAVSAVISPCGKYRYRLERPDVFGEFNTAVIMVNPSTADATENDATIRKLIGFRNCKGWGNLIVGNLFAFRATDVRELATAGDPIGPDNDYHLRHIIGDAAQIIVAWGPTAKLPRHLRDRWRAIAALAQPLGKPMLCIGDTVQGGHPRHPLMPPYSSPIVPWSTPS